MILSLIKEGIIYTGLMYLCAIIFLCTFYIRRQKGLRKIFSKILTLLSVVSLLGESYFVIKLLIVGFKLVKVIFAL